MPLNKKWRSLDFFGSLENLHLPGYHQKPDRHAANRNKITSTSRPRLSSLSSDRGGGGQELVDGTGSPAAQGLVQRCVIIQKDERGYGLTVSGDNPVYVASVKPEGAAAKAGVQKDDRIVKVNGTLVTNRNHIDVVRLIKSGSYVALTLMGRPNSATSLTGNQTGSSPTQAKATHIPSNRDSKITAPQPVDPDKDRELLQQKVHMTQVMFEQANEDFEKHQRQYVKTPSERLHAQLLEKERTVRTLENQLKQLTAQDATTPNFFSPGYQSFDIDTDPGHSPPVPSVRGQQCSDIRHMKQASVPANIFRTSSSSACEGRTTTTSVMRSKSDAAAQRRQGQTHSTFYVGLTAGGAVDAAAEGNTIIRRRLKRWKSYCSSLYQRYGNTIQISSSSVLHGPQAASQPTSDAGSMSDSPSTSPSISPTPVHPDNRSEFDDSSLSSRNDTSMEHVSMPVQPAIITIDDEEVKSDEEQVCDTGPFSDIHLLDKKPAHMGVFLHYLISNCDPSALFFYIVTDVYKQTTGNTKDLRKWGYEIFSTFLAPQAPLLINVDPLLGIQVYDILAAGASRGDNETTLRLMFDGCRAALSSEISDQLADFRNKRDLGLGSIFGVHELRDNMDKATELKMIDKYLMPHLKHCIEEEPGRKLTDRDQAIAWALATFFRQVGLSKTSSGPVLERVQSFIMKDKRSFKIPGSRSSRAKPVRGHQFSLQHFYVPTLCSKCEGLIWGVGYQGFICQSCEMGVHKQCVDDLTENCTGKKRGKRASAFIPVISTSWKPGGATQPTDSLGPASASSEAKSPPHNTTDIGNTGFTQPLPKDGDSDLSGLPTEHSVRDIVKRYHGMTSPTGPGPGPEELNMAEDRKGNTDLSRSESLKGKGDKAGRPPRRSKSDVDRDDMFRAINQQSGSSSASSLSNRSMESPGASSEHVNNSLSPYNELELEVEELPSLKEVLGDDVCKKLKPKEKKRQEVINELFHTEKAHVRNLKMLDLLFNRPLVSGLMPDLARGLFPNIEEMITLHESMNKMMKERRSKNPVVEDVADILLVRFDGEPGDRFRKACAEYCRNQSFALDALKRHRRKDQRLSQFLGESEAHKLCRKLELKDHVPCQMQRLTKYPMLIENLMKYTQNQSQEYKNLERALERSKHILAYVNQAVRDCENYHKLKDMQKRLDTRAIDVSSDSNLGGIKKLNLTEHKLIHDGPLVWRLRSHRLIELQVLLLDDILVLLQRVDDRLVLKCQSTNQLSIGADYKYTHSPVLKLQNLLARQVATDKKAFFVINTSDTGPQIYELVAQTQDARKTWCKLINEKAEENKRSLANVLKKQSAVTITPPDEISLVRNRIMKKAHESSPPPADEGQAAAPAYNALAQENTVSIGSLANADYQPELIQPEEINVTGAVTAQAQSVLSPLERLQRTDQLIDQALREKEQILADILDLSISEYQHLVQQQQRNINFWEEEEEFGEQLLVASCIQTNNRLIQLISSRASSLASHPQHQGSESDSGSGSSSQSALLPSENDAGSSQLRQQQAQLAQGAAGQNVTIQVPMDQLRGMANEMNSILSNLLNAMGTRGAERQSLRSELQMAQEQLDMLKAIQQQMMTQQSPSTPHSRPQSFISVGSSISETGDSIVDDSLSVLNVAETQELMPEIAQEMVALEAEVQPQVATAGQSAGNPDDDSDDGYEMYPENLPLPDENSVSADAHFPGPSGDEEDVGSGVDPVSDREGSSEPMTTDLDEGGEDGRSTPVPSSPLMGTVDEEREREAREDEEDRDSIITISADSKAGSEDGCSKVGETGQAENNNTSNQDAQLHNPIQI